MTLQILTFLPSVDILRESFSKSLFPPALPIPLKTNFPVALETNERRTVENLSPVFLLRTDRKTHLLPSATHVTSKTCVTQLLRIQGEVSSA
jgi:hypothetical protein